MILVLSSSFPTFCVRDVSFALLLPPAAFLLSSFCLSIAFLLLLLSVPFLLPTSACCYLSIALLCLAAAFYGRPLSFSVLTWVNGLKTVARSNKRSLSFLSPFLLPVAFLLDPIKLQRDGRDGA